MRLPRRILIRPLPLLLLSHSRPNLCSSWQFSPASFSPRQSTLTTSSTRLFSNNQFSQEDQNRWEQLYQEGEQRRNVIMADLFENASSATTAAAPIQIITFDLDNTLWNTGATIGGANDELAQFLNQHNIVQSKRTEEIMGELFRANPLAYCPLAADQESAKAPVLLTRLRKDALQQILITDNQYSEQDAQEFADTAFEIWMQARYKAIPSQYASNVLAVLEQITNTIPNVRMGAITDGNSDPRNVPELASYFEFCINAEQVGVAKPDARVYQQAIEYVKESMGDMNSTEEEEGAGPWWVHIGDDFSKDIVAAKNLHMRTIWARELILDKLEKTKQTITEQYGSSNGKAVLPEKELLEFQERINSQTVVQMAIGADDYLMASIQQEFTDAVIDSFEDLPGVLKAWHEQSLQQPQQPEPEPEPVAETKTPGEVYVPDEADLVQDWIQKEKQKAPPTKFCVFCGAKNAIEAKFCSSCGEKQPELP